MLLEHAPLLAFTFHDPLAPSLPSPVPHLASSVLGSVAKMVGSAVAASVKNLGTVLANSTKVDTAEGLASLRTSAEIHVPYAMVLYERYLGRPFASHRDAVSELVGELMENPVEKVLADAGITYRKTNRAEKIPGFDQAPDFMIPDEHAPRVIIEAKIASDDGTARDKFTRLVHLAEIRDRLRKEGKPPFQVVACIDGVGFSVRREDMRRLLRAYEGKVFTLATLDQMVPNTNLTSFLPARKASRA
jgi:hypothetical protein